MTVWDGARAEEREKIGHLSLSLVRSVLSGQTNPGGFSFLHMSYYEKIFTLLGIYAKHCGKRAAKCRSTMSNFGSEKKFIPWEKQESTESISVE